MTRMRVMKARSTDYCAELILLTSIYLLDLQRRRRYANVLNSGNEAIDKTNMRGQQTKIHYLAISKHAPSSRATSHQITSQNSGRLHEYCRQISVLLCTLFCRFDWVLRDTLQFAICVKTNTPFIRLTAK